MVKRTFGLVLLCFTLIAIIFAPVTVFARSFTDIPPSYRAYDEIMYLAQGGIVTGNNNGTYAPQREVTRAEAAVMLGRALGLDGTKTKTDFKDVKRDSFASGYIQSAVKKGIIQGFADGTFRPDQFVTRGQMALFISRAFGYGSNLTTSAAASQLMERGIALGMANGDFGANKTITRADYAVFLARAINYKLRVHPRVEASGNLKVTANGGLNVRTGPSTAYSKTGWLKNGELVNEIYRVGNWIYVKATSIEGFVSGTYVAKANQEKPKENPKTPVEKPKETPDPTEGKQNENQGPSGSKTVSSQVIVIDAGHGAHDPGADGFGLLEKNVNLDTALKVQALFANTPFKIVMTREDDTYPTLDDRVAIAKKAKGNVFVSIHSNAFNGSANGIETYYYAAAYNPYVSDSIMLATAIQNRLVAIGDMKNRGVKKGNLKVLRENNMPAALVELGFIDNAGDNAKLKSEAWRQKAAQAIYWGILDYYKQKGFQVSQYY